MSTSLDQIVDYIEEAKQALFALGTAYRGDWSQVDGRTLRAELDQIGDILDGEMTADEFKQLAGIDPETNEWE